MNRLVTGIVTAAVLLGLWQAYVSISGIEAFLLPGPVAVMVTLFERFDLIMHHLGITALEIVLGLLIGTLLGVTSAILIHTIPVARRIGLPLLVISQAIPVFALAPLLVLWLGYDLWSKVAMAVLIIFFPVTTAFLDGLRRTDPGMMDLASIMAATRSPLRRTISLLIHIRIPAALPALASGLRVATGVAPIGAVVGEWVGSSAGLGFLMLHANGRMQIDLLFAALFVLSLFSVLLWLSVDALLRRALPWQPDSFAK